MVISYKVLLNKRAIVGRRLARVGGQAVAVGELDRAVLGDGVGTVIGLLAFANRLHDDVLPVSEGF